MSEKKENSAPLKEYTVRYGNDKTERIEANSLLNAQKAAHKKAAELKTIALSVVQNV